MTEEGPWFIFSTLKLRRKYIRVYEKDQEQFGISASEGLMLKIASLHPGITVTELGNKMGYNKSLVTKNLKKLLTDEYIETKAVDGRTLAIHVTKKGWELINFSNHNGDLFVEDVFANCTPEERDQYLKIGAKLKLD